MKLVDPSLGQRFDSQKSSNNTRSEFRVAYLVDQCFLRKSFIHFQEFDAIFTDIVL